MRNRGLLCLAGSYWVSQDLRTCGNLRSYSKSRSDLKANTSTETAGRLCQPRQPPAKPAGLAGALPARGKARSKPGLPELGRKSLYLRSRRIRQVGIHKDEGTQDLKAEEEPSKQSRP